MRIAAILALALLVCACGSVTPVPVKVGEVCETCEKQITDLRFAAEAITQQGDVLKFRTPECLATYVRLHPEAIAAKFVTDYTSGRFIRPESATYVRTIIDENTRERSYAAFAQVNDAVKFAKDQLSSPIDWLMIQRMSAGKKSK